LCISQLRWRQRLQRRRLRSRRLLRIVGRLPTLLSEPEFCVLAATSFLFLWGNGIFDWPPLAFRCKSRITGADGAFSKASDFEPGRPPDIARRPFHNLKYDSGGHFCVFRFDVAGCCLAVQPTRPDIGGMSDFLFRCQTKGCGAEYGVIFRAKPPDAIPKCVECDSPFPPTTDGLWLHYQPAWSVSLRDPDAST
jgi:hypothetical protein